MDPPSGQSPPSQDQVRNYITTTLASALEELAASNNGHPSITLSRRSNRTNFFINPETRALESTATRSLSTYSWPGKNAHEAWKFTVVLRVLAAIAEASQTGIAISKRDIYYSDPTCFGSQRVVDIIVDDFAHTIGVERAALKVEAAAKGLVSGHSKLTTRSGQVIETTKGILVPPMQEIAELDIADTEWVLVLEKEAIWRRLTESEYHTNSVAGKGVLVTGKGYPDLSTRAFIRKVLDSQRQQGREIRLYCLVDSDPDGMAIMSIYKYGSMASTHENARLNIHSLRWLGLHTSDAVAETSTLTDTALMSLTTRDRRKIVAMLSKNPVYAANGPELKWRVELQQMLMLNVKAEIELLYDCDGGLEGWIDQKMESLWQN